MSEFAKDKDVGDLISRKAAIDSPEKLIKDCNPDHFIGHQKFIGFMDNVEIGSFGNWQFANGFNMGLTAAEVTIKNLPSAQPEIIRCKDCKHKPTGSGINHDIKFPEQDYRCPCRCEDHWYSWIPDDDWFCANGERREE